MGCRILGMRHDLLISLLLGGLLSIPVVAARAATASGVAAGSLHAAWFAYEGGLPVLLSFVALVTLGVASTRAGRRTKERLGTAQAAGGRRTARHVMANATPAALFLLGGVLWPDLQLPMISGACAALAGSLADTVAGELGMLSPESPRMLLIGRRVDRGVDGGMTLGGLLASLGAALAVGGLVQIDLRPAFWPTVAGGVVGSLCDSVLGATIERKGWLGNEGVNFWSSVTAGCAGALAAGAMAA